MYVNPYNETSYNETSYNETSYNETSYNETSYHGTSYKSHIHLRLKFSEYGADIVNLEPLISKMNKINPIRMDRMEINA